MDKTLSDILEGVKLTESRNADRRSELDSWSDQLMRRVVEQGERRIRREAAKKARQVVSKSFGTPKVQTAVQSETKSSTLILLPFCTRCGNRCKDSHKFCTNCGKERRKKE